MYSGADNFHAVNDEAIDDFIGRLMKKIPSETQDRVRPFRSLILVDLHLTL